ncbi:4142_t:CDS:2 [Cetraspora pellucida]|uniref:4142_t:CDS:1 n=1 Tax=Cetraspora pellucida TaxID=1433469 RepID=A0A9N9GSD7_9GLOM|nr:4142_t:CDS:2 [Cetraspora pellucida]
MDEAEEVNNDISTLTILTNNKSLSDRQKNNLLTVSLHKDKVSILYIYNDTNLANIQENDNISLAISSASKEVDQFSNDLYNDDSSSNNIFQNSQKQLKIINQPLKSGSLLILNNGNSSKYLL